MRKSTLFTVLAFFPLYAVASPLSFESSLIELQQMSESMQKINTLLADCQMENDCIITGLEKMIKIDNDSVAKSMLEDLEKRLKTKSTLK